MRFLALVTLASLASAGLFAQQRGSGANTQPKVIGSFGSVVFPGGTSAMPGVTRTFGSVVFPGTGGPKLIVPGRITDPTAGIRLGGNFGQPDKRRQTRGGGYLIPYPVYVGASGYSDSYFAPAEPVVQTVPTQVQPIIVYPQQAAPVILQYGTQPAQEPRFRIYEAPREQTQAPEEPPSYMLAFKDGTIYSAANYWVDGDTVHYFTSGNKHNQASISLIDRATTEKLNRNSGMAVTLPAEK
jgi:hypothetical protein